MFGKFGRLAFISLGATSAAAVVVAQCSTTPPNRVMNEATMTNTGTNQVVLCPPDYAPMSCWDSNWDRSDPRFLKRKVFGDKNAKGCCDDEDDKCIKCPTARRNIYLIRHAQYNQKGDDDDCHTLTKLGEEQSSLLGKRLAKSGIKFTSIISSGMCRAMQTADIMLKEMKECYPCLSLKENDTILNEGPPCIPEPPYRQRELWDPDYNEFYAEGARIEAAFRKYFHRASVDEKEDTNEIIVCHANVIRYFAMRAMQFPPEAWLRLSLEHSSITRISLLPNGDVVLKGLGDSGHLPADKTTC
jgi:serine/threonine-protein phosphatase PGAM5